MTATTTEPTRADVLDLLATYDTLIIKSGALDDSGNIYVKACSGDEPRVSDDAIITLNAHKTAEYDVDLTTLAEIVRTSGYYIVSETSITGRVHTPATGRLYADLAAHLHTVTDMYRADLAMGPVPA